MLQVGKEKSDTLWVPHSSLECLTTDGARFPSPGLEAGEGKEFALDCELLKPQDYQWLPVLGASRQGSFMFVLPGAENIHRT